jgi:predicted transglutaminase-like cysteine proteinase
MRQAVNLLSVAALTAALASQADAAFFRAAGPAETGGPGRETWRVARRAGNCHDYAVTKRHELIARGWPSHALIPAEVVTSWGEHHLVLVVRTRDSDLVLDNVSASVRPMAQIRYPWVRAQSPKNPNFWSTVRVAFAARPTMVD